jgi:hypothetical protein
MTSDRGLQMNSVLSNVKFELQLEEDKLKNGWYPKIISIFTSDRAAKMFESQVGFRLRSKFIMNSICSYKFNSKK